MGGGRLRPVPYAEHIDALGRGARIGAGNGDDWSLLVPILRAQAAAPLIDIGDALVRRPGSEGFVLGLVEVPPRGTGRVASSIQQRQRDLLRWIAAADTAGQGQPEGAPRLGVLVRVTHEVALGLREAIWENGSDVVVIEWPGPGSRRPRTLGRVLRDLAQDPPANLLLVRPGREGAEKRPRIVVPVRGGANAIFAVRVGAALAEHWQGEMTVLHVFAPDDHPARVEYERQAVARVLDEAGHPHAVVRERQSRDVPGTILEESIGHGTVILGS
ncbi:MAG: universal stress protein, partial [Candidatus Dormibacteraeota bacterium]|nr:universal stress protein [Candidatus Dormibacteraeota bacterium]